MAVSSLTTTIPCLTGRSRCSVARKRSTGPRDGWQGTCKPINHLIHRDDRISRCGHGATGASRSAGTLYSIHYQSNQLDLYGGPGRGGISPWHEPLPEQFPPRRWRILY